MAENENISPKNESLLYSPLFGEALINYRQALIASLGVESEALNVRSDEPISLFEEKLRLVNFISMQLKSVNKFISGYCPAESEE